MDKLLLDISADVTLKFSWCPPGAFTLLTRGTSLFRKVKSEKVNVIFSKGFWISSTCITVNQWNEVLGTKSQFKTVENPNLPVFGIDYREANLFLNEISRLGDNKPEKGVISFPNYCEWQYACEARTNEDKLHFWKEYKEFGNYAWFRDNSHNKVHEVATKLPNPWGIYDMYGNVLELCIDVAATNGMTTIEDPISEQDPDFITVVGGDFSATLQECQVTQKRAMSGENSYVEPLGVRLVYKQQS